MIMDKTANKSANKSDGTKKMKRDIVIMSILTLVIAFMDISGLPSMLLVHITIADIQPFYFSLMVNFVLIVLICYLIILFLVPKWDLGLKMDNFIPGLKRYALAGIIAFLITIVAFSYGLWPFNNDPSIIKVIIEGFLYYIGVAIVEELYVRGLLLNIIEKLFGQNKNATFLAVVLSSSIFGIGHVFGVLGSPLIVIISKVSWTIGLGFYLGTVYKKTNCLWLAIALHAFLDFSSVPFCFSTIQTYPIHSLYLILPTYLLLGVYGLYLLCRED